MQRYIGLDVHTTSTTMSVVSERGKQLKSLVLETNGQALVEAIRLVPGRRQLCIEEGTHSSWLYEVLSPHVEQVVVTRVERSRGPKDDARDAFAAANALRLGTAAPVFKDRGQFSRLRTLSDVYSTVTTDVVRVRNRIKGLYRSRGVPVSGRAPRTVADHGPRAHLTTAPGPGLRSRCAAVPGSATFRGFNPGEGGGRWPPTGRC